MKRNKPFNDFTKSSSSSSYIINKRGNKENINRNHACTNNFASDLLSIQTRNNNLTRSISDNDLLMSFRNVSNSRRNRSEPSLFWDICTDSCSTESVLDPYEFSLLNICSLNNTSQSSSSMMSIEYSIPSEKPTSKKQVYQQPTLPRNICGLNRWIVLSIFFVLSTTTGSFFFNWPATETLLLNSGAYSWLCYHHDQKKNLDFLHNLDTHHPLPKISNTTSLKQSYSLLQHRMLEDGLHQKEIIIPHAEIIQNNGNCIRQIQAINSIMPIGVASWFCCSFLGGILADLLGPKITTTLGIWLSALGWFLLSICTEETQLYFPAFGLIGGGIDVIFMGILNITNLFPNQRGLAVSLFNAGRSIAFAIPLVMSLILNTWTSLTLRDVTLMYSIIIFCWTFVVIVLVPWKPHPNIISYEDKQRHHDIHQYRENEEEEEDVEENLATTRLFDSSRDINNEKYMGKTMVVKSGDTLSEYEDNYLKFMKTIPTLNSPPMFEYKHEEEVNKEQSHIVLEAAEHATTTSSYLENNYNSFYNQCNVSNNFKQHAHEIQLATHANDFMMKEFKNRQYNNYSVSYDGDDKEEEEKTWMDLNYEFFQVISSLSFFVNISTHQCKPPLRLTSNTSNNNDPTIHNFKHLGLFLESNKTSSEILNKAAYKTKLRLSILFKFIISPVFFPMIPYSVSTVIRSSFLANSANDQLHQFAKLFTFLTPLSFIPAPLFGFIADRISIYFVFYLLNTLGILQFLCLLFPISFTLALAAVLNFFIAGFSMGQIYCYVSSTFPVDFSGTLIGILIALCGLLGLIVTPMYNYSTNKGSFTLMNSLFLGFMFINYLCVYILWRKKTSYNERRKH